MLRLVRPILIRVNDDMCRKYDFGGRDQIEFFRYDNAGLIRLTRANALNALTSIMVRAMERALRSWGLDTSITHIIIEGEGRAFCAGGDVVAAYHAGRNGEPDLTFFADEYRLNALIASYPKPMIALLDGIVMGGGAGISIHGSHRVVTENTVFAMPESAIGFVTDVGSSVFLSDIAERFGLYLGLSGATIRWGDCLRSGLATHAIASEYLPQLRDELLSAADEKAVNTLFSAQRQSPHGTDFYLMPNWETSEVLRNIISEACAASTVSGCIEYFGSILQKNENIDVMAPQDLAGLQTIVSQLVSRSPTSLKVIHHLLTEATKYRQDNPQLTYSDRVNYQLEVEYRIVRALLYGHDFYTGVKAVLIDKTNAPDWQPKTLDLARMPSF